MNPFKRYLFQVLFYLVLWCLIWISNGMDVHFIRVNGSSFLLQALLLFVLVYHTVPQFLFKKKYIYFFVLTIPFIFLSAFICTKLGPEPIGPAPLRQMDKGPPLMASRFFRQLLIMSVTCLSAVLIETFTFAQQKERSAMLAKVALVESELKFLKMQINPHFLFNALNNIYALSVNNSEKTQESISTLSMMLRYVLYDCERPQVPLQKELEYIKHFIELFKLKSSEDFNINFIKEVESDALMVPPMLFVPFIENAFKHSGIEKRGKSFVTIWLKAKENRIEFFVENSIPSKPLVNDAQGGIGLQNVEKRLGILYPQTHQLDIKRGDTFKIHLKMNLQ